jgi:hypothetical protein
LSAAVEKLKQSSDFVRYDTNCNAHLALACRDNSVAGDKLGHNTTRSLNTERERAHVDEDDLLRALLAGENTALNGSTMRHSLVRVDALRRLLPTEVLFEELLNLGDTSRSTDKNNLIDPALEHNQTTTHPRHAEMIKNTHIVDLLFLHGSVLNDLFYGLHGLPEEIHVKLLELGTCQRLRKVVPVLEGFDLDTRRLLGRKRALRLLNLALKFAKRAEVLRNVGAALLLVSLGHVVDDTVVEIFTAKVGVAGGRQDFEDAVVDREERDIEGTTTKIVDNDLGLATFLVQAVGNGGSGRFVDDTEDRKTSYSASVLGRLTLSVIEVYRVVSACDIT